MAEHPVDVISQITADHRAVEALFADLAAGHGDPSEILYVIVRELSLHAGVEELLIYPVARDRIDDGDRLIDTDLAQHQALKEVLVRLDGADATAESALADIETCKQLVAEHIRHEENEMLPALAQALPDSERAELGSLFLKGKGAAPTHPHPHAPNTPPLNAMADAVAAIVDKARDAARNMTKE